jgi:hypothetical protein
LLNTNATSVALILPLPTEKSKIQDTKTLSRGLIVIGILSMLVGVGFIGKSLKAVAYTEGYFFNLCNDKKVDGDNISCTSENNVNFTQCQVTYKGSTPGIDIPAWFCGKSDNASLTKAGGIETIIANCNKSNSTYECGEGSLIGEVCIRRGSDEVFFCKNSKGKIASLGDSKNVYEQPDKTKVMPLIYNDKDIEISCLIEVIENTTVNGSYLPKKIIACAAGSLTDPAKIIEVESRDGQFTARANCQVIASQVVGNISPWNRGGVTLNCYKEKISFSGGGKTDVWFSDPTFQVLTPENKIVVIKYQSMDPLCGDKIRDAGNKTCKITKEAFFKEVAAKVGKDPNDFVLGETGTGSTGAAGVGEGNTIGNVASKVAGDAFTLIYRIIAMIIFALLFVVRYFQTFILLAFISIMTVLLNLSPNTSFLTQLAVPLWGIFAQIANLGAVFVLIYLGSATMIGIMKYDEAIKKGTQVALYTFVSSFTYFGLAFVISLLDGFTKLIVYVFGGGSIFKLFEALLSSVSSISTIGYAGLNLVPDVGALANGIGKFGQGGTPEITTNLVSEIIVVVGLTLILIVFKNIFFMLLTRVAILLLLLITSPMWVLGYLVKDSLPGDLKGQMEKAVTLTFNSIVFNFAFILTLVLVTIITQKINDGTAAFITNSGVSNFFLPQTNSGLALLDPVTASAQQLSDSNFSSFGAGFTKTISVCTVLAINLVIIQQAFKFVETLIDDSIVKAGQAVGGAVSKNLQNFRKAENFKQGIGMLGQDIFKGASYAVTGDNQLIKDAGGAGAKGISMGLKSTGSLIKTVGTTDGRQAFRKGMAENSQKMQNKLRGTVDLGNSLNLFNGMTFDERVKRLGGVVKNGITADVARRNIDRDKAAADEALINREDSERNAKVQTDLASTESQNAQNARTQSESDKADILNSTSLSSSEQAIKNFFQNAESILQRNQAAFDSNTQQLESVKGKIKAFQDKNGYTDDTTSLEMDPSHRAQLNNFRAERYRLTLQQPILQSNLNSSQSQFDRANSTILDARGSVASANTFDANAARATTQAQTFTQNAKGFGERERYLATRITEQRKIFKDNDEKNEPLRYLNDASKISDGIDSLASGGKSKTKFKDEAEFQEAAIKEALDAKKERAEEKEERVKDRETQERQHQDNMSMQQKLYEQAERAAGRTPPPGP